MAGGHMPNHFQNTHAITLGGRATHVASAFRMSRVRAAA